MGTSENKGNNNAIVPKYPNDDDKWTDFIWNGKTGQLFGRTGMSWVKITVFYIIFYAALGAFAWLCYYLFATWTLTTDRPRWILDSSLIGTNPGVGFRPMPNQDENSGSSLIWYKRGGRDSDAALWYNQLSAYTTAIEDAKVVDGLQVCSYENGAKASLSRSCRVDLKEYGNKCSKSTKFGYPYGEPCFLIKLNRIYGWKPEPIGFDVDGAYDEAELDRFLTSVGDEMPDDVKDRIKSSKGNPELLKTIWISCQGEDVGDRENLGNVEYYPRPGIPAFYFPYYQQASYQSPFVFVQLNNPKSGVVINIECRAWANNIVYSKPERLGSVHFEVMID